MLWIASGLWLGLGVRVGIRVYVNCFVRLGKGKTRNVILRGAN